MNKCKRFLRRPSLILWMISVAMFALTVMSPVIAIPYGSGTYDACTYDNCIISVFTSGTVNLGVSPTSSGVHTTAEDQVSVETDSSTGYTLTLRDADTVTDLVKGSDIIATSSGTPASPVNLAVNTWGWRMDGVGSFGAGPTAVQSNGGSALYAFAGMPASTDPAQILRATTGPANPADTMSVWYGVHVNAARPSGSYTDAVTYTAVIND